MAKNNNIYKLTLDYIPIYSAEYLNKLQEYNFIERGAFVSIVHLCVITNGILPEKEKIYRRLVAYTDEEKNAIDNVIEDAKNYVIPVIERMQKLRETRANAGRKGGKQNGSKTEAKSKQNDKQNDKQNGSIKTETETETEKETNNKPPKVPLTGDVKCDYKFFYENVPIWFNTILHELPGVTTIENRKSIIKARCSKLKTEREWKVFFLWIKKSDFLMGKIQTRSHENFKVTFDWILTLSNFIKIIEGNYHERQRIMINDIQIKNYYLFLNNTKENINDM